MAMTLDPVLLSRLQFFWVIALHILLPAFTIGLSCYIALLEWRYWRTGDRVYFCISAFWLSVPRPVRAISPRRKRHNATTPGFLRTCAGFQNATRERLWRFRIARNGEHFCGLWRCVGSQSP